MLLICFNFEHIYLLISLTRQSNGKWIWIKTISLACAAKAVHFVFHTINGDNWLKVSYGEKWNIIASRIKQRGI